MKLKSISIVGFRSIDRLEGLTVGSPTVLAGHNDAGKSAIIHAVMLLLDGYTLTDSDRTYLSVEEEDSSASTEGAQRVPTTYVAGTFELNAEESQFGPSPLQVRRIASNGSKAYLEVLRLVPQDPRLRDFSTLTNPQLEQLLETLGLDTSKGSKAIYQERLETAADEGQKVEEWIEADATLGKALPIGQRFDASSAVDAEVAIKETLTTAYRSHLQSEDLRGSVREIEKDLETLLVKDVEDIRSHIVGKVGDIGDVHIKPSVSFTSANGLKTTDISVRNNVGEDIDLRLSGAGRARRIALAIWEYNANQLAKSGSDIVLLYDEPDTHLDYGHQRELMTLIHAQTLNPKVTVMVASHSMNLIDGTDISDVVHVKHQNHRTVVERLADDSQVGRHLGAIAASVGLRNTVLLHERLFVGVEGESEARALPVLFKLATGRHLESCGIAIWPCANNEGARHFAAFLHERGRNVVFLVDADSTQNAKHIFSEPKLLAAGLDPQTQCLYIGDPNEIEDVFTDDQWVAAANDIWPRTPNGSGPVPWTAVDFAQHRTGKFSQAVLDMVRTNAPNAPSGKPEMLASLALSLKRATDVPRDLSEKFEKLIELAG
ncbi:ATP-dependent nuclease [Arthrobacter sp.]|uniref:ATP-dependent nuclease n=1 Tax=Arthrobacter sp. TaxID=1667 RepID=UPI003A958A8A